MKLFDRVSFLEELRPNWSDWQRYPRISLKFLCYLVNRYDPKKFYSQLESIEEHKKEWARLGQEIAIIPLIDKEKDQAQKEKILNLREQQKELDKLITDYESFKHEVLDTVDDLYKDILFQLNRRVVDPTRLYYSITLPEYDQITFDTEIFADWLYYRGTPAFPEGLETYLTSNKDNNPRLSEHINSCHPYYDDECKRNWERWEQEKEVLIETYSKDIFSEKWEPDWNYWRSLEVIPLKSLCYLAFNVDIKKVIQDYESVKEKSKKHYLKLISLHKHADRLYEQAESFIPAKKLDVIKDGPQYRLYASVFIDWLLENNIPFPDALKKIISVYGDLSAIELVPILVESLGMNPIELKATGNYKRNIYDKGVKLFPEMYTMKYRSFSVGAKSTFSQAIKRGLIKKYQ